MILTFLAGAEIDPVSLRKNWKASLSIGFVSFLLPLLGAFSFCRWALDWHFHAAEIGGVALSTTSVAVVYAVMVETGLNRHDIGKLILAACFVTDLGHGARPRRAVRQLRVAARRVRRGHAGWPSSLLPSLTRWVVAKVGHRVSEPDVKFLLVVLMGLGGLADQAGSEAVLPAYVVGLVVAGVFLHDRVLMDRMRAIAFALLTPFFFLHAGLLINAKALVTGAGVIGALLLVKVTAKFIGVWPADSVQAPST